MSLAHFCLTICTYLMLHVPLKAPKTTYKLFAFSVRNDLGSLCKKLASRLRCYHMVYLTLCSYLTMLIEIGIEIKPLSQTKWNTKSYLIYEEEYLLRCLQNGRPRLPWQSSPRRSPRAVTLQYVYAVLPNED